jgi:Recombinase zinc beta ribbon domain
MRSKPHVFASNACSSALRRSRYFACRSAAVIGSTWISVFAFIETTIITRDGGLRQALAGQHRTHSGRAADGRTGAVLKASCMEAEPAHRQGAATRAQMPALLKGLIYGPNGRAMSPSHTRRRGRIYRYYVSREAIADGYDTCVVTSVPAADVESAVLDQVQNCSLRRS